MWVILFTKIPVQCRQKKLKALCKFILESMLAEDPENCETAAQVDKWFKDNIEKALGEEEELGGLC
jgi:hypothetical protein